MLKCDTGSILSMEKDSKLPRGGSRTFLFTFNFWKNIRSIAFNSIEIIVLFVKSFFSVNHHCAFIQKLCNQIVYIYFCKSRMVLYDET